MGSVDTLSMSDKMSTQSQSSMTLNFQSATTTTISTIALQSGTTRLVIAVLQSGQFINLRILEMSPNQATITRNTENSEEMLRKHEDMMEKLRNKRSPVEELLEQADRVDAKRNPEVYMAMTESLGSAWRDVNDTLDLRRKILQKTFDFHKNRTTCLEYFVQLCQNKKQVLVIYRYAVEDGRRLIDKLKEAAKEEPEEAAYSIGLVDVWLDELQTRRFKWQEGLKVMTKKEHQKLIEAEFERIIREIEDQFNSGQDHDDLRNRLLHLSANLDKSEVSDSKKSKLQRIVYNLIERITIIMELEEEIRTFIQLHTNLDKPNFGEAYEEKLQVIKTFELQNIEELQAKLEKRFQAWKDYKEILANPLDYEDDHIQKLLNVDSGLDLTSALEIIKLAKEKNAGKSAYAYWEGQILEAKLEIQNLTPADGNEIRNLKMKVEKMSPAICKAPLENQESSSLIHQCQELIDQLNAAAALTKFMVDNNILDADEFLQNYATMLSSELSPCAPTQFRESLVTRLEIRRKYDAMMENPTAFNEGHIQTICNWDPTLDTRGAYETLRLLCLKSKGPDTAGDGNGKVKMQDSEPDSKLPKHPDLEEQWQREIEEQIQQESQEALEWQFQESETQRQLETEIESKRQQEELERQEAERKRQNEELERKRHQEELERKRQQEERERQELERKRQQEELEWKRQQEELEWKRQQEELEWKRQQEELERKRQQEESERRELEWKRQQEELEWKRQQEELERKRQQEESELRELEWKRQEEERARQEAERKHQEELEQKRRQEELMLKESEWKRQQEEIELKRGQEEIERKQTLEREAEAERKRQLEEFERKRQKEELERQEFERNRQLDEIEQQRKLDELEEQRHLDELQMKRQQEKQREMEALELKRQREAEAKKLEDQRHAEEVKREEDEKNRMASELEARKIREEHLDELFKTLDFSLPENLKTARNDLKDFQKFETIVEEMDNPPLELIEKMYEKKNKIIQCLQFYELIQKQDRILYIREIRKLEYELFQVTTVSDEIENESQMYSSRIEMEIQPVEAVQSTIAGDAGEPPLKYSYTSPGGDFFTSMSDNEVQEIFEQSTMQTQTGERHDRILANSETQTQRFQSPEPVVILMQEPAKILSTIQTQTPTLPRQVGEIPATSGTVTQIAPGILEFPRSPQFEELKPESPAKLLLTSETQTVESGMPDFVSEEKIYVHKESEMRLEKYGVGMEPKFVLDNDTQTHEPSPQLLCNSSAQTKISGEAQRTIPPAVVHFAIPEGKKESREVPFVASREMEQSVNGDKRRPSVSELVASLNTKIKKDISEASSNLDTRHSPIQVKNEKFKVKPTVELSLSVNDRPITTGGKSVVTTKKRLFEKYEEEVTTRFECPSTVPATVAQVLGFDVGDAGTPPSEPSTLPRRKVKDFKKMFEEPSSSPQLEIQKQPRNVPILVEFPAKRKVGEYRQLFENIECPSPPPLPAYQVSSIRHSSKYDATNRNYESNYTEHVSCHGVDNPVSPPCSPYVTFQDSRPESSASDYYGMRRPTKFVPAKFTESDYESDYEAFKIEPIWVPPSSKGRPMSAYEFRPTPTSHGKPWEDYRPKSSTFGKPEPPPKPAKLLAKPIAIKKPIPPPKPTNKLQADNICTDQMMFNAAEPLSDTLQRHKQLTSTLTKTEECKFFLRPVSSPVEPDDELRVVRKSVSPTHYTSVTSSPVHFHRFNPEASQPTGKFYNKETFREERTWKSFDRTTPKALEFAHHLNQLESTSDYRSGTGRPKSTEFRQTISSDGTGRPNSMDAYHAFRNDAYEEIEPKEKVHEIKIVK